MQHNRSTTCTPPASFLGAKSRRSSALPVQVREARALLHCVPVASDAPASSSPKPRSRPRGRGRKDGAEDERAEDRPTDAPFTSRALEPAATPLQGAPGGQERLRQPPEGPLASYRIREALGRSDLALLSGRRRRLASASAKIKASLLKLLENKANVALGARQMFCKLPRRGANPRLQHLRLRSPWRILSPVLAASRPAVAGWGMASAVTYGRPTRSAVSSRSALGRNGHWAGHRHLRFARFFAVALGVCSHLPALGTCCASVPLTDFCVELFGCHLNLLAPAAADRPTAYSRPTTCPIFESFIAIYDFAVH